MRANLTLVDRIAAIATAKGVTSSQLAIAWTMSQGTVPIPGTRRTRYLEQNTAAANIRLAEEELAALEAAAPAGSAMGERYSAGMLETLGH